jgi:hypothetical protein
MDEFERFGFFEHSDMGPADEVGIRFLPYLMRPDSLALAHSTFLSDRVRVVVADGPYHLVIESIRLLRPHRHPLFSLNTSKSFNAARTFARTPTTVSVSGRQLATAACALAPNGSAQG